MKLSYRRTIRDNFFAIVVLLYAFGVLMALCA